MRREFNRSIANFKNRLESFNRSSKTVLNYVSDIEEFRDYIIKYETVRSLDKIKQSHLERYISHLSKKDNPNSYSTINRKISALNAFYKSLVVNGKVDTNIAEKIVRPKVPKGKRRDYLTMEERDLLIKTAREYQGARLTEAHRIRNYTMIKVLSTLGLRAQELADIDITDIDLNNGLIWVKRKGGDYQEILPPQSILEDIKEYLKVRDSLINGKEGRALFISSVGTRFSTQAINNMVKSYVERAGLDKNITTHSLRHTVGYLAYANTKDIRGVQTLLGHKSPQTTAIYTDVRSEEVRDMLVNSGLE